jgi:hypothetical protein
MSYHVVLTSLSCVTKFFSIHFFFSYFVWLCYHHVIIKCSIILIITSYLSSYICIGKFFFFCIITLVAVCCYTTLVVLWDCYGLVCRFTSLCVVMKLRIKKNPHGLLWYPHILRCARTCLLSWVPHVGWVSHVSMLRMRLRTPRTSLRSHSTCHSPVRVVVFFKKKTSGKFCLTRSRHKRSLWLFRSAGSRRPCRAPFCGLFFKGSAEVDFSSFLPLDQLFSSSTSSSTSH